MPDNKSKTNEKSNSKRNKKKSSKSVSRNYFLKEFKTSDFKAAINVALLALPQSIAYAALAGLPLSYGISATIFASIVAPFFSSNKLTILGPTNATAFMIFGFISSHSYSQSEIISLIPVIVLLVGGILIVSSLLRLADLVQYISHSVIIGYISGAAILIIINQFKHVVKIEIDGGSGSIFETLYYVIKNIGSVDIYTFLISIISFSLYMLLNKKFKMLPTFAITLAVMSVVCYFLSSANWLDLSTYDSISLKNLMPDFSVFIRPNFFSNLRDVVSISLAVAFLASLENSVMSKSLSSQVGVYPNQNKDMFSVGMANIACAFFKGMPASGSLTRSALNFKSGAQSKFSSILSGLLCLILAFLIAPLLKHVPKCVLSSLIIAIAITLININQIKICFFSTKSDAIVLVTTFLSALLIPLHVAIFLGVGVSIILYLRQASKPYLVEYDFNKEGMLKETKKRNNPFISIVHVEGELFFGASELFRTQIQRVAMDTGLKIIILRMKNAHHLDATSVMALIDLIKFLRVKKRNLIVSGIGDEVYDVLYKSGTTKIIGEENIFHDMPENPNISTKNALIRANEILGGDHAEIKIYYDPQKK